MNNLTKQKMDKNTTKKIVTIYYPSSRQTKFISNEIETFPLKENNIHYKDRAKNPSYTTYVRDKHLGLKPIKSSFM